MAADLNADLNAFSQLVETRRTNLRMDLARPVSGEVLTRLCELAQWAPNHHRTFPWRFAVLTGAARQQLGDGVAAYDAALGARPERVEKSRTKYLRAPVMLLVASSSADDADPVRRLEDRDAVAAGVQNLLLAATAAGLASFWASGSITEAPQVRELCGFAPTDAVVAAIYLGWPLDIEPNVPARPQPKISWLT